MMSSLQQLANIIVMIRMAIKAVNMLACLCPSTP